MTEQPSIADAALRERALDASRSFIVQAPAGSGKTELLIQRLLVLLGQVDEPEQVVAITFTRKAAGEMRARLLDVLTRAGEGEAVGAQNAGSVHEADALRRACAVVQRDRVRGWKLLEAPARLRIQTIDSFSAALARQHPVVSGLGGQPAVSEDSMPLYRGAAQATLALLEAEGTPAEASARLLRHLASDSARAEGLLCTMLARRDQWLRHLAGAEDLTRLRHRLEAALQAAIRDALRAARAALERQGAEICPHLPGELPPLARYAAAQVRDLQIDSPVARLADLRGLPGTAASDHPAWNGLAALLTTQKGDWRKTLTKREGFPTNKSAGDGHTQAEMKQRMLALLGDLARAPDLAVQLRGLCALPPPTYDEGQWAVLEALLSLLPQAVARLREEFAASGAVDYVEVALAALRTLEGGEAPGRDAPGDAAGLTEANIRHVLVDEFQDTSHTQFRLLERLTAGWPADGSHTLFLVGDPMQSIYRFREAEVGLYLRTRREGIGGITLEPLTLKMNFRSAAGLAAWVNGAFPAIMPPSEDAGSGAVPFARAIPYHGAQVDPAVVVHPMLQGEEGDRAALDAAEAQQVAAIVTEVRAARPDDTVAVLVRSRAHLQAIAPALQRQGLSYRAVEIEALAGRQIVQDLLTLTRALLHPADRIAWLALLRAPWCGLTLADLLHLAAAPECTLWERMVDAEVVAGLSADGQARLARVVDVMRRSAVQRARKPLRRWVEGAWLALGAPACFPASELADARAFLGLLEGMESRREPLTVERLTERLEGLFATPDALADERLQLMSMHKAKGLEFDTVILPGLGKRLRADDPPLLRWFERPTAAADEGLLLAPIHEAGSDGDAIYRYLAGLEKEKAAHETGRLLYVAATRARRQLHLLGHARLRDGALQIPPSGSLLRRLWEVVQPEFQLRAEPANDAPPAVAAADGGREAPSSPLMRRLVSGWRLPDAPPDVPLPGRDAPPAEDLGRAEAPEFSWAGATARQVGTVVHRLLRIIARHGAERLGSDDAVSLGSGAIRAALAGLGVAPEALEDAASRVEEALRRTLEDPRGLWALRPHAEARSEYAVTAMVDGRPSRFVVDRTFVDEGGTRWIIDFKTGTHEGGALEAFLEREQARYRPQLENYAAVMGQLDPARPIRVGLYFPLLTAWREWTPGH